VVGAGNLDDPRFGDRGPNLGDKHVVEAHDRWDPAACWPGECRPWPPPGRVGAFQESSIQQIPEWPVVPAGVEVSSDHLLPAGGDEQLVRIDLDALIAGAGDRAGVKLRSRLRRPRERLR